MSVPPVKTPPLNIKAMDFQGLQALLKSWGAPSYTGKQLWAWLYEKGETDPALMTNLPAALRQRLAGEAVIPGLSIQARAPSTDGTVKYAMKGYDGRGFESVYLPTRRGEKGYNTVCVSTQVGCAVKCPFCATGQMGFGRNLLAAEMVDQINVIERDQRELIRNIVLMGMGEPLMNYEATVEAVRIWREVKGLAWKRITLSTSGYLPGLQRLVEERVPVRLALSLHAPTNELRDYLVPLNKKYPLESLIPLCREYVAYSGSAVTFEYVLLSGVNDSLEMAKTLAKLAGQIRCKINIIPWNPVGHSDFQRPDEGRLAAFIGALRQKSVLAHVRRERGLDVQAACGQLILKEASQASQAK